MKLATGLTAAMAMMITAGAAMAQQDTPAKKEATPAAAAPAKAQPEKVEPTLKVGVMAPEFKVEKFFKGTPITGFEKGKVYVVEFWATWCGPCIASMPHLSELQKEYADKGLTICGINIWEDREYNDKTMEKAAKFVEGKGDGMGYTVAYDGPSKFMDTTWMKAAGRNGIPSAFVVDQKGMIAWIGHPMQLDMVIDEVLTGKWDPEKGPEKIKTAFNAFKDAGGKYKTGLAEGDAAWTAAAKQYPAIAKGRDGDKFRAMLDAKLFKEAYALGGELVDRGVKNKNAAAVMEVVNAIDSGQNKPDVVDKALLVRAAQANLQLTGEKEYGGHVIMARAYYATGDKEKAQAEAAKAVELAPEEIKSRLGDYLKQVAENADKPAAEKK